MVIPTEAPLVLEWVIKSGSLEVFLSPFVKMVFKIDYQTYLYLLCKN